MCGRVSGRQTLGTLFGPVRLVGADSEAGGKVLQKYSLIINPNIMDV